jgi:hypothetical protein
LDTVDRATTVGLDQRPRSYRAATMRQVAALRAAQAAVTTPAPSTTWVRDVGADQRFGALHTAAAGVHALAVGAVDTPARAVAEP